jgi:UDP-N-acetyl-D-mannosaminuronate dehydrogenase
VASCQEIAKQMHPGMLIVLESMTSTCANRPLWT